MLRQRVMTAVVLLAGLAAILASENLWLFTLLMSVVTLLAGWEWQRLSGAMSAYRIVVIVPLLAVLIAVRVGQVVVGHSNLEVLNYTPVALFSVVGFFWMLMAARVFGLSTLPRLQLGHPAIAVLVLWATWAAAVVMYATNAVFFVVVLLIPIVADTAAYFVGRAYGKRKLAPTISPGKTLEGAFGGLAAVLIVHGTWVLSQGWRWWWIVIFVLLTVFSITGDLFESLLKRQAGVKDSSNLLPGHGGVLDRIDAQLPVLPLAALAYYFVPLL